MCPLCITATLLIVGSVASAGGLATVAMKKKTQTEGSQRSRP